MKKNLSTIFIFFLINNLFSQQAQIDFIKGNINDKITVITSISKTNESEAITKLSIDYIIQNKQILGNDKELESLTTATILSINEDFGKNFSDFEKNEFINNYISIYNDFSDSLTVQTALLQKCKILQNNFSLQKITDTFNTFLLKSDLSKENSNKVKSILDSLCYLGNNTSFTIISSFFLSNKYEIYNEEFVSVLSNLVPLAPNTVIELINESDVNQIIKLRKILLNNSIISTNLMCKIAENVIKKTILLIEDSSNLDKEIVLIQLDSLKILNTNKWTRASSVVCDYFDYAKTMYNNNQLTDYQFAEVIEAFANISPIDSVSKLVAYLEELNSNTDKLLPVSQTVIITVIQTLGAIGNKSAFDSLLEVTYLNYPEPILTAARNALSGLKW